MKNQKGFSLIELLIVVIIIAIIAVIAIPNLLASRRAANEGSAISAMRNLHTANTTFQSQSGTSLYAATLAGLNTAGLIDLTLASATTAATAKSGYYYTYTVDNAVNPRTFNIIGQAASETPLITATGTRRFWIDQTGVMRWEAAGTAPTAASAVLNP